ncbi:complement C1q-like protein 3 [Saccostrea cucullata]|uniref:complement C1q-like protein 3 n=1 Tax=Saccostrea cuccullata TaxID=36930 RepID=UPI002ED5A4C3
MQKFAMDEATRTMVLCMTFICVAAYLFKEILNDVQRDVKKCDNEFLSIKQRNAELETKVQMLESSLEIQEKNAAEKREKNIGERINALETSISAIRQGRTYAFTALLSGLNNNYGSGQTIVYDNVKVNTGGCYSGSNGIFTAPVAGIYFFSWSTMTSPNVPLDTALVLNAASNYRVYLKGVASPNSYSLFSQSTVVQLAPGDRVWIVAYKMGAQNVHGGSWPAFSGFRV